MVPSQISSDGWRVLGRPGRLGRAVDRRRREFDARFGPGEWKFGHVLRGEVLRLAKVTGVVEASYASLFRSEPKLLTDLCAVAADVFENARSNVRSALDYSVQERKAPHVFDIALRRVVRQLGQEFNGKGLLRIGGAKCSGSPLSPGRVPFIQPLAIAEPREVGWWDSDSILSFWESNRVLLVQTGGS